MTTKRCPVCDQEPELRFERADLSVVRCAGCGLEWQRSFPDARRMRALYGESYLERWGIDGPTRRAEVRAMKQATYGPLLDAIASHHPGGHLLDVGCALGFLVGLARRRGFEAYGVDVNASAIQDADPDVAAFLTSGELAHAFPGLTFDAITLIDVLEHVPEPGSLLDAVADRLAPGGVLVAVLPNAASVASRLLGRRWPHYAPEHLWYWTPVSLTRFLETRGWRIDRLDTGFRKTFTLRYLDSYTRALGRPSLPGLAKLGRVRLRLPTGEMCVVARRPA